MDPNQEGQGMPETSAPQEAPVASPEPIINATDQTASMAPTSESGNSGSGAIIGSVIVIIIIILGGFYFWSQRGGNIDELLEEGVPTDDAALNALQAQSASDGISSIESDLNATDLDDLDAELGDIDALLDASI